MNKKNKFLLSSIAGVLIIIFIPLFGGLYEKYLGPVSGGFFWGPSHPEYIDGFFVSYMFFVSLFVFIFGGEKKYKVASILLGILLFIDLVLGSIEGLIIDIGVILIGWLLAHGILLIYSKIKK